MEKKPKHTVSRPKQSSEEYSADETFSNAWLRKTYTGKAVKAVVDAVKPKKKSSGW